MILITLNKIREKSPCANGWQTLLVSKGKTHADDVEFPLTDVLGSNGLADTFWCLRCMPEYDNLWRLFAVWCAEQVKHLLTDERSLKALDVARNHAKGLATDEDLDAAWRAAWDAAWDAAGGAAWDAAGDAARAAAGGAAGGAAWRAAGDAAGDAAWAAAGDAARAAAWAAAGGAAWDAAWDAARAAQKEKLREVLTAGKWVE